MDEYGYKMFFASTNDDETVIFDLNENEDQEKAMKMLNSSELINMRKETGINWEIQETLSIISKHKVWKKILVTLFYFKLFMFRRNRLA